MRHCYALTVQPTFIHPGSDFQALLSISMQILMSLSHLNNHLLESNHKPFCNTFYKSYVTYYSFLLKKKFSPFKKCNILIIKLDFRVNVSKECDLFFNIKKFYEVFNWVLNLNLVKMREIFGICVWHLAT